VLRVRQGDAVALATEQGHKVSQAARSSGINDTLLRRWRQKLANGTSGARLCADEREELQRPRL